MVTYSNYISIPKVKGIKVIKKLFKFSQAVYGLLTFGISLKFFCRMVGSSATADLFLSSIFIYHSVDFIVASMNAFFARCTILCIEAQNSKRIISQFTYNPFVHGYISGYSHRCANDVSISRESVSFSNSNSRLMLSLSV